MRSNLLLLLPLLLMLLPPLSALPNSIGVLWCRKAEEESMQMVGGHP